MKPKLAIVEDKPLDIGPSLNFLRLTRNPALASPARFQPTKKRDGDVVI